MKEKVFLSLSSVVMFKREKIYDTAINFRARAFLLFLFLIFLSSRKFTRIWLHFFLLEFIKHTRDDDSDDDAPPLSSLLLLSLRRTRYNDDIRDP